MADKESVRVEIAFRGGPTIGVTVTTKSADGLVKALESGDSGVQHLDAGDSTLGVVLADIAYVRRWTREGRVGFSS